MTRLVSIIGTDGSGKTTISAKLVEQLVAGGIDARQEWLGAESYLMAPVRRVLKLAWRTRSRTSMAGTAPDVRGVSVVDSGYRGEIRRKNELVTRFSHATPVYIFLVMLDYRLQLRRKLRRGSADLLVADRYVFDVGVNLGLALGWSPEEVVRFLQRQLTRIRLPDVRVFLRVQPEVSLARKDDIPDAGYLALRLAYYDAVAQAFGFTVFDGSRSIEEIAESLLRLAREELLRPHVHYVHANNADVGGADRVLVRTAQHMGSRTSRGSGGYRVSVSLRRPTAAVGMHEATGTAVLLRDFERPQMSAGVRGLWRFTLRGPLTYLYFRRLFSLLQPDLVHVNDVYDFLPAMAAQSAGIPVVHHLRMFQRRSIVRRTLGRIVARSPASVAVSNAVRQHYFDHPVAGHRAEVIHDLGDATLLRDQGDVAEVGARPAGIPSGGRLVTMVGRIEEWKGQSIFLDAVARLEPRVRERATFLLVGGPVPHKEGYFEEVSRRAGELDVFMAGLRDDVPAILRASDVSVHASTEPDPFPGVVVESLLAGTALIGTRAGGVPEMINTSKAGILVQPGNAKELAAALTDLLNDPTTPRARFARVARAQGVDIVDSSRIDAEMHALYDALLAPADEDLT